MDTMGIIRRARTRLRRSAAPDVLDCVDCGRMLHCAPGPGRAPLRCPDCSAVAKVRPKWRLAPDALDIVQRHFGLRHPIHVRRIGGRHQLGAYRGPLPGAAISKQLDPRRTYHLITISSALDPQSAARALLHEACHAHQRERDATIHSRAARDIRRHGSMERSERGYRAYREHPVELEARAAENAVRDLPPLMVPG